MKILANNVIIDTGPLVAMIVKRDYYHFWSCSVLSKFDGPMFTNSAVLTESFHLLRKTRNGVNILIQMLEEGFVRVINTYPELYSYIHRQMKKYRDTEASFADINILAMYEQTEGSKIFTIDSDFRFYRTQTGETLRLIMPDEY